ncbi:MazG family protein [Nocardioides ferulae]|uniref:MazG family protein n=1 Tax=Nocardioides ferulae TaxID=2340821 RepID=UPI001F0BCF55|nr:MazG family protein [Nocardioides ferulae]
MVEPAETAGEPLLEFRAVMRRLQAECGWKRAQTHRSLARYLLEETYETLEAIDTGDLDHLREELGDLLLQVYFHALIAEQEGAFTLDDVARDITAKMYRRNTHVFGGDEHEAAGLTDPAAINEAWEAAKADEKQRSSVTDGLPPGLPALLYADKVLDRLQRAGTPARVEPAQPVVEPAAPVVEPAETIGDRLLALVAEARAGGVDPEQALRDAVRRVLPG